MGNVYEWKGRKEDFRSFINACFLSEAPQEPPQTQQETETSATKQIGDQTLLGEQETHRPKTLAPGPEHQNVATGASRIMAEVEYI